jgi:Mg-chelatase subunit ChlD
MGLCYRTSLWLDRLWAEHLELSPPARDLVHAGIGKQGPPFAGFGSDLHARLYLPSDPATTAASPDWATHLHELATELTEWQRLRLMCARNGFAAAIAAEAMLEQLLPHVPDAPAPPSAEPNRGHGDGPQTQQEPRGDPAPHQGPSRQGQRKKTPQKASQDPRNASQENPNRDNELRAALRRAVRTARDAVRQAEAGLEGMNTPLGLSLPASAVVPNTGPANLKAVRDAHSRLGSSLRLRRIAELAGRLERVAAAKTRSRVKPGVGEVHGIGLGGLPDLARLLPSELVALRRRPLRLHLLARLLQARALGYEMTGREPQARGPIVVLLDESGSMREAGKDIWSKAVCLALLATATRQRRSWSLVGFNGAIVREHAIAAGKATAADIQHALDHGCRGGTDFDAPVLRAVDIIRTSRVMKKADVVLITDGEDALEPTTIEAAQSITRSEGVSWFCVGVGPDAEAGLKSLAPIATSMVRVRTTEDADDLIAPVINLDRQQ